MNKVEVESWSGRVRVTAYLLWGLSYSKECFSRNKSSSGQVYILLSNLTFYRNSASNRNNDKEIVCMYTFFVRAPMRFWCLRKILFSLFPKSYVWSFIWSGLFLFCLLFGGLKNWKQWTLMNKWRFMYWPYIRKSLSVHWYFKLLYFNRNFRSNVILRKILWTWN